MTDLESVKNALLQTLNDHHEGFFRDLPFKHAIVNSLKRVIESTRKEEIERLKMVYPSANILFLLQQKKDQYDRAEDLPKFDAISDAMESLRHVFDQEHPIGDLGAADKSS